jgi:hypothetical protein
MALKAMSNNGKHKFVTYQLATGHDRLCLLTQIGTRKNFGSKQIAG